MIKEFLYINWFILSTLTIIGLGYWASSDKAAMEHCTKRQSTATCFNAMHR